MKNGKLNKGVLGTGIYTIPEISRLLNFPQAKVRRYITEYWDSKIGKELFNDTYSWSVNGRTKAVNFFVLIELYTFFQLQELGVKNNVIMNSRRNMIHEMNTPYPFASAGLLTDGKKIWYEFKESIVNADGSKQTNFIEILRSFTEKIEFNKNKIAETYWPLGKDKSIIVDPHHQFGQPVIKNTNINAEVIFSMYQSGETVEVIRNLYDLSVEEVRDAISYCNKAA